MQQQNQQLAWSCAPASFALRTTNKHMERGAQHHPELLRLNLGFPGDANIVTIEDVNYIKKGKGKGKKKGKGKGKPRQTDEKEQHPAAALPAAAIPTARRRRATKTATGKARTTTKEKERQERSERGGGAEQPLQQRHPLLLLPQKGPLCTMHRAAGATPTQHILSYNGRGRPKSVNP